MSVECQKCHRLLPETHFHADNKSGWSNACKACRQRKRWRVEKRRARKRLELLTKAEVELQTRSVKLLNAKLKELIKEFKKFTLANRNRLNELEKRTIGIVDIPKRTKQAIISRRLAQERAEGLLELQSTMVQAGLIPPHISDLWREHYGDDPRGESQEED